MNKEKDTRPRILLISDTPVIDTGMGRAHCEIATRLYDTGKYNIASFGWFWKSAQQRGIPWKFPWKQYSAEDTRNPYGHPSEWNGDYEDPQGDFDKCSGKKVIDTFKPDIVIAIGDVWMCDYLYFLPNRNSFKLIHEFPIDGEPVPESWVKLIRKADVPIVMSEYALNTCHDIDPFLNIQHIYRGINSSLFKPLPNKELLRKKFLPSTEGRFVVGVFDRFQDRKQIPRAVEAFAKFKSMHKVDNCDLYLHMDLNDTHSIQQKKTLVGRGGIIDRYNLKNNVLINYDVTVEKGVPLKELVALYNCCDVKLSTTQGEGFGLCVHPDTLIQIDSGVKKIKDIQLNDKVLSHNGTYSLVTGKTKREVDSLYEVTVSCNEKIKITEEHPFLVSKECRGAKNRDLIWVNVKELRVGHFVATPIPKSTKLNIIIDLVSMDNTLESSEQHVWYKYGFSGKHNHQSINDIRNTYAVGKKCATRAIAIAKNTCIEKYTHNCKSYNVGQKLKLDSINSFPNKYNRFIKLDDDCLYAFGWYLAEGCAYKNLLEFNCGIQDVERFKPVIDWLIKNGYVPTEKIREKRYIVTVSSKILSKLFFHYLGHGSKNKSIHPDLMIHSESLLPLVKGYIYGDGNIGNVFSIATVSPHLAYQTRNILLYHNVVSSVSLRDNSRGFGRADSKIYTVNIHGKNAIILSFLLDIDLKRNYNKRNGRSAIKYKDYMLFPVRNIRKLNIRQTVYDIAVKDSHSFVGNGILLHNTTLESMSCGIPCIGTNYTTLPELLGDGRGLTAKVATYITGQNNVERALVDTSDTARCLETLYRSRNLREQMGLKSRKFATELDWSIIFPKWEIIIDSLLKKREYKLLDKIDTYSIQREKQEINIQGAIYESTGFSVVTSGFALALNMAGHDVSIQPRIEQKPEGIEIPDHLQQLVDKENNNDIEIINHMPDECFKRLQTSTARIKIVYFPWELTEVKNEWIDMINRDADAFWCNSNFIKNIFVNNGALEDKVYVVPNGISVNVNELPMDIKTDKKYKFLMVGNLGDKRKNTQTLVQAYLSTFTGDDDVCLVLKSLPGHVDSDPSEMCENLVRSHINPPEILVIHRHIPNMSGLYKACDCFVTATYVEGFCQPMLNALSVGMPIIAPNYGGYLDFVPSDTSRFALIEGTLASAERCPVYIPNSKWFNVDFAMLKKAMLDAFKKNIVKDGKNYVEKYTWNNTGKIIINLINSLQDKKKTIKCYYKNFTRNMWNDDNRENLIRYAPSNFEFIDIPKDADLQVIDITRLSDFKNIQCKNYIVNFHCRGEWSEEKIEDYLPYFEKAVMVYSHLDIESELPTLKNVVRGPWGVDHRKFYKQFDNIGKYMILNTGSIPETEGIYESVIAADNVDANIFHTGPNLQLKNKSYKVSSQWLTVPQMQEAYQTCKYTSGMRRIEGFEKTVIEGLLCGSRPICFDTALYKYWYSNLVEYVKEGTARETAADLQKIFSGPYRAVTDKEREIALQSFAWVNVARSYWDSFNDITGGDNGR